MRTLLLGFSALLALPAIAAAQTVTTRVVVLGTGTPNPDPERSGPAVLVVVNNTPYLFDAGAGVVRRAEQANRAGVAGTAPGRIGAAFLTHLHSDHTVGLPDLIHTGRIAGRKAPLQLFGPPGTSAMAGHLAKAFREDIRIREEGLEPDKGNWWKTVARNVTGGEVYRDSNVVVTAIPVPHANWKTALAYRVVGSDGRVIVISGDTGPSDGIVKACDGCDVLVHEVYSAERLKARPADWQAYHRGAHTSTVELAALAGRARPKLLVLYHQLYWGGTDEELLAEIRAAGYTGAVLSARDLAVYE